MTDAKCKELYAEIDKLVPALEYCLAAKKEGVKSGASALRAAAVTSVPAGSNPGKTTEDLDKNAKVLFEWVKQPCSRVRMLMNWQAAGGLSYVASVHHLATQCFVMHGNKFHEGTAVAVSLEEVQAAVRARHRVGGTGIPELDSASRAEDFA